MNKSELLKRLKETQGDFAYKKQAIAMVEAFKHEEKIKYSEIRSLFDQEIHLRKDDRSLCVTFEMDLPPKYKYSYRHPGGRVKHIEGLCSSHNFRRCLSLLGIT